MEESEGWLLKMFEEKLIKKILKININNYSNISKSDTFQYSLPPLGKVPATVSPDTKLAYPVFSAVLRILSS